MNEKKIPNEDEESYYTDTKAPCKIPPPLAHKLQAMLDRGVVRSG